MRRATSRASSSRRRRSGTGGGRSTGASGSAASSVIDADARQEPRRPFREAGGQGAARALGVHPDLDLGQRLRRLAGEARLEPGDQRLREVGARGQGEDAGAVARRKERAHRASSASASAMAAGRPTSTQVPAQGRPKSRPSAISASQTALSEKTSAGKAASAAVSRICAPA